ncbi:MAG: nuclear transport factor 2 family protein [Planctomycetota bacterium]
MRRPPRRSRNPPSHPESRVVFPIGPAWCSQDAARVASFITPDGSLTINAGKPAPGTAAIAAAAQGFMSAFVDMVVTMDALDVEGDRVVYRWTLTGTNNLLSGTGRSVHIGGHEQWTFGADGRIARSLGDFDEAEYPRHAHYLRVPPDPRPLRCVSGTRRCATFQGLFVTVKEG